MIFGLFRKKDPICGMKEEKGKGFIDEETGCWFCSEACRAEFGSRVKEQKKHEHGGCCH